jgi:DNA repair protein RadD
LPVDVVRLLNSIDPSGQLKRSFVETAQNSPPIPSERGVGGGMQTTELRRESQHVPLFDYQRELSESLVRSVTEGIPRLLLSLPTGGGKTRTAMIAILKLVSTGTIKDIIWLAPSNELLEQAIESASTIWQQEQTLADVTLFRWGKPGVLPPEIDSPIIQFATPQLLSSRIKNDTVIRIPDLIVFDEAHHLLAQTFHELVETISEKKTVIVGLSATPGRSVNRDTEDLSEIFDGKLLVSDLLKPNAVSVLRRRGILADLRFRQLKSGSNDQARFKAIVDLCRKIDQVGERAIVFSESVDYGEALHLVLQTYNARSANVSGRTPLVQRQKHLRDFESGHLKILINTNLLTTGYDAPGFQHLILGAKVGSPTLFEQIVGRAARGSELGGVAESTVWQFEDHLKLHGYPASYYRYEEFEWSKYSRSEDN